TGSAEMKDTEQSKSDKSDQFDDIIQNSTLSVHAAEFVPKSYPMKQPSQQQPTAQHLQKRSIQDRLQLAREMPLQSHMTQQVQYSMRYYDNHLHFQQQVEQTSNDQHYGYFNAGSGDYKAVNQASSGDEYNDSIEFAITTDNLMSVIHSLILYPGRFTSIVPPLINDLRFHLKSPRDFQEIIKLIIQQSINEGNFRYSGARLCDCFDSAVTPAEQKSFREILYTLCKSETESRASSWKQKDEHTEDEQKKCHGLILFLAELVTQMEHTSAFGLGDLLIQLIITVLKKPAPNSVKNICQALKLAGQTLEKDKRSRKEMETMMRALTELVTAGRVDSHVGRMVHSVHQLRNGNWGQTSTADTSVESTQTVDPNQTLGEPVFYGPDGKVLTAEEKKFLADVADCTTNIDNHVTLESYYEDEMKLPSDDDEIDEAYEEFLKIIPKQMKFQAQE
ncbi:Polyadenylate-binding protein-interacting protein 1, partial [Dufourea novaeangliae]